MSGSKTIGRKRSGRRRLRFSPAGIATVSLAEDLMLRDVMRLAYLRYLATGAVRAFYRQYHATSPLHSKRSPRLDDLRDLQQAGLTLRAAEGDRRYTRQLLLEPLARMSAALRDYETFVMLFEAGLAEGMRFGTLQLRLLADACDAFLPGQRSEDEQDLRERLDTVRERVLQTEPTMPSQLRAMLAMSGNVALGRIQGLKQIPPAERSLLQQALLVSMLLQRSQRIDRTDLLVEIIDTLDASLPALSQEAPHTPEGSGPQLLLWLSIVVNAKSAYCVDYDLPFDPVEQAVARAVNIDDTIWNPNTLYERLAQAMRTRSRQAHCGFIWSVNAIPALWRFDFIGGEALRRTVIEAALETAETGQIDWLEQHDMGVRLVRSLSYCEGMWIDPDLRETLLRRCRAVIAMINEPRRTMIRGLYHLALDEQDEAEALFATRRGEEYNTVFNGSGHATFIPTGDAARYLSEGAKGDPRFLARNCGFRFDKPPSVPSNYLMVATCADPLYIEKYYHRYASSLFKHDRKSYLHIHLLGRPEEIDPEIVALIRDDPRISLSSEEPPIRMPYYYATARFLRAPLFQRASRCAVLLTDIDAKFQQSPNRLFHRWQPAGDVGLRLYDKVRWFPHAGMHTIKTPRIETWTTLNASCVFYKRGSPARHFARDLARVAHFALDRYQHSGNSNWFIDQNVIFAALRPAMARTRNLHLFNLLDVGIPFGIYQVGDEAALPPRGQHPGMPDLSAQAPTEPAPMESTD